MKKALIKIAYKQVIDVHSKTEFERNVFNDSYSEFCMQVQSFTEGKEFTSWADIRKNPKANTNVQYKTGFSIGLYIKGLANLIPGLPDSLGRQRVSFESHQFEILESDTQKKSEHRVAITYASNTFIFFGMMGEYMLLAAGDQNENIDIPMDTFLLKIQSNVSVVSYKEMETECSPVDKENKGEQLNVSL